VRLLKDETASCGCRSALKHAILTQKDKISPDAIEKLAAIVGKYLKSEKEQ
jgi:hypothetical protein